MAVLTILIGNTSALFGLWRNRSTDSMRHIDDL